MTEPDPEKLRQWPADGMTGLIGVIDAMPGPRVQVPGYLARHGAGEPTLAAALRSPGPAA